MYFFIIHSIDIPRQFLKRELPTPRDDSENLVTDPKYIIWSPVCRSDVAWNFEKFLINHKGVPYKR